MAKILPLYRSDKSILEAIHNKDETVLDYLYKSNSRMINKLVVENNGSQDDAVELLQDVLVLFWEKNYNQYLPFFRWITVFISLVVSHWTMDRRKSMEHFTRSTIRCLSPYFWLGYSYCWNGICRSFY